jgi:GTP pyrophosphokinase
MENYRKFIVAISNDIRVLIIKLCDKLHNMRTIDHVKKEASRYKTANETLNIYAPLAGRIGMEKIKKELEERAFRVIYPQEHDVIEENFKEVKKRARKDIPQIINELKKTLLKHGIMGHVSGRIKTPYSIWLKMNRRRIHFDQISDIIAFRVVVSNIEDCYKTLGVLHAKYPVVPDSFNDYIAMPKPNGYQSLHTYVIGPLRHKIEVQIRTTKMHHYAEFGVAAHWVYKEKIDLKYKTKFDWLRNMLDIIDNSRTPEDFMEQTKIAIFRDTVFCFTPEGDIISLPAGATPLDFAYYIHSEVGNHCVAARVNGQIRNIRSQLKNGDQVEIVTSKSQTPSPEWERYVVTAKARSQIKKYVREERRSVLLNMGKSFLMKVFSEHGKTFKQSDVEGVLTNFGVEQVDDLYILVAEGEYSEKAVFYAVYPKLSPAYTEKSKKMEAFNKEEFDELKLKHEQGSEILEGDLITGVVKDMPIYFAKCCHPVPGDKIVGVINTGKGVTVHRLKCKNVENISDNPHRIIDVGWNKRSVVKKNFVASLHIVCDRKPEALSEITTIMAKEGGNVFDIRVLHRSDLYIEFSLEVEVLDKKTLNQIVNSLRKTKLVNSVSRVYN